MTHHPAARPRWNGLEDAEAIAVAALGFLAADAERLSRFLSLTGLDPAHLRAAAAREGFLAGVMAHIAGDEPLLVAFAAASGRTPEEIAGAFRKLNPDQAQP